MAPKPLIAKIDLRYPIYACDFDPRNHDFLLVGGGGGESRSGVPNKITLLNTSQKTELSEVVDIELTNKEDNVQTLAYAQSTDQWATALAGINSSQADQQVGKNEHLRSFLVEYPPKRKIANEEPTDVGINTEPSGQTRALGRTGYFTPSGAAEKLTYQRVLRLSKREEGNGPRLGVVASGLAPEGEIVVFVADTSRPGMDDVRARLNLGDKIEAADVDIMALEADEKYGGGNFRVAYCTDNDIFCIDVNYTYNRPGAVVPQNIYGSGHDYKDKLTPGKFRCLRLLTPTLILVLLNLPKQKGSQVLVMELTGAILAHKRLHGKIKSATGLSVASLPYPENYNHTQHAIAIAGADRSITILTLDHPSSSPYGRKLAFRTHSFLPAVHDNSIMSLTFSSHLPPNTPYISPPTQYLKLASTSMVNTAVVHTFILPPYPAPTSRDSRPAYLLTPPSKQTMTQNTLSVLIAILAIAIGSFFLQAFTEIRGGAPEYLGAKSWLSPAVHDWIARPYMFEDGVKSAWSRSISSEVETATSFLSQVVETPSSVLSSASTALTANATKVTDQPLLSHAKHHATSLASAASSLAFSAWSQAGLGASMVSSSASAELSGASSVLSAAASSGSSSLSSTASRISSKASSAASAASSSASSGYSDASSALSATASSGSSKASSAASSGSSSASSGISSASSAASTPQGSDHSDDSAPSLASSLLSSASAAAASANSIAATDASASPLASSASEILAAAASVASSAASEGAETVAEGVGAGGETVAKGAAAAASRASSAASGGAETVTEGAVAAGSVASSAAGEASETISSGAEAVSSTAAEAIDSASQKTLGGLRALLAQRAEGVDRHTSASTTGGEEGGRPAVNVPHEIVVSHVDNDDGTEEGGAPSGGGLSVEAHPPEHVLQQEMEVKRWDDLDHKEKMSWRQRLHDAGEYAMEETETVLQGVLFSGLGAVVGAAMGG